MIYHIAEKFKSPQGEGVYAGTPMAFIRFVGCSVGKTKCHHCDTDFDKSYPWRGGGQSTVEALEIWAEPYRHVCLTGGEPLDQDLFPFFDSEYGPLFPHSMFHLETSGTKMLPDWMGQYRLSDTNPTFMRRLWICVSPKPGYLPEMIEDADEVKVIYNGLGNGEGWPSLKDAVRWADEGKVVFLQPRNEKLAVNKMNLKYVLDVLKDYPQLRLSMQLHKMLGEQ